MSAWQRLADLPVSVDGYVLEDRAAASPPLQRRTTTIVLSGAGEAGAGEDVVHEAEDREAALQAGPILSLAGDWTLRTFSERLQSLDLFPVAPRRAASVAYRTWAYESAALDLALRQADTTLHSALGRNVRPLTFVNSLRLSEPPSFEPVRSRLERYPTLRLKLDATASWDDALLARLAQTGAVDSIDLKGQYAGMIANQPPDPELYRRVVQAFPHAWIEDPMLTEKTEPILRPHRDRITWDAPIRSVASVDALPFPPRMLNIKPSRLGSLRELFALYDHCETHGIQAYGGGQAEQSVGRGQLQLLAAIFHPDTPNDVAPIGYNDPVPAEGLPSSPMTCRPTPTGFGLAS